MRGYGERENSLEALAKASVTPPAHIEIDTRITANGEILVYHDPVFRDKKGSVHRINELRDRGNLPSLDNFLSEYRNTGIPKILIDIKDFGEEGAHLELVERHGLRDRVIFVSWVPHILHVIHRIDKSYPLYLSHRNLTRWRGIGRLLSRGNRIKRNPWGLLMSGNPPPLPPEYRSGFNHALVCCRVPDGLLDILTGVCIHRNAASKSTLRHLKEDGLKVAVYSTKGMTMYKKYATNPYIDLVFADDAGDLILS